MTNNETNRESYRETFGDDRAATQYDSHEYGPKSWSSLLWRLERESLSEILARPNFIPNRDRYLDFACGTGRVTQFLAPRFGNTVGLDISDAMLEQARLRVPSAVFIQGDVKAEPSLAEGKFDLITAFRFILNADVGDRLSAMLWLRRQMRDDASRLIVNNHSNMWTHKAVTHAMRSVLSKRQRVTGNVMSHRQMVNLVDAAGLSIESVHGMGFFGGTGLRLIPFDPMLRLQRVMRERLLLQRLGEDQIYVLEPR